MTLSYRYLIDPEDTKDALKPFLNQKVIGLDTETYHDRESGRLPAEPAPDCVVKRGTARDRCVRGGNQ